MDAQEIDLADESVDGVLCRFGVMLMPEPTRAVARTRTSTSAREGGSPTPCGGHRTAIRG